MRLEKIRLAGFKSFVDPTTVPFPGNLVGVVGPNGCGKSNVIDAVRWVMGESSAKMLRGESMADVIFNGSTSRKPVGTAAIELVFDNGDGSAGHQYAKYAQISVKRQISRDGQSSYFLNGTRCRRRDITDLFLGTGLGPRSYSIIEQGMISRLIEARPEDLRLFIEEAAGISKYKERRRETESRIKSTRENLDRLNDVREEVGKQLLHLERQAATAERYKRLKQEERQVRAELTALRWMALAEQLRTGERRIAEAQTDLEAGLARQRHHEAEIAELRETYDEAGERFSDVQGQYYAVGAEIARVEQAIQFSRESRQRRERDLAEVDSAWRAAEAHRVRDEEAVLELERAQAEQRPQLAAAEAEVARLSEGLHEAEGRMQQRQSQWDELNQQASQPAQTAQVERARINHLEHQLALQDRRARGMEEELARLDAGVHAAEIGALVEREGALQERLSDLEARRELLGTRRADLEATIDPLRRDLDAARTELQAVGGREASLEALQEAALAANDESVRAWLQARGLGQAKRLAEHLRVEPRWRRAVETALGPFLQAVCVPDLDRLEAAGGDAVDAPLVLFQPGAGPASGGSSSPEALSGQIQSPWPITGLLGEGLVAEDLEAATRSRGRLAAGQFLVTPEGVRVGRDWVRYPGREQPEGGVLARAEELESLGERKAVLAARAEGLSGELERQEGALRDVTAEHERSQSEMVALHRELSQLRSALAAARARLEHVEGRRQTLATERADLAEQEAEAREAIEEARLRLHAALEETESFAARREVLAKERERLRASVTELRSELDAARRGAQEAALAARTQQTRLEATALGLERVREQLQRLQAQRESLAGSIEEARAPLAELNAQLEQQLTRRLEVERELGDVRERLEGLEGRLRRLEQDRQAAAEAVEERRRALDHLRLQHQEVVVRSRTLEEQLREGGHRPQQLLEGLPAEAAEPDWQERLDRLVQRIDRLGPINLAAIDEFREQAERKRYLDEQHADVTRSLDTLEEAIRRIDRETRSRFKETFDRVNAGLQQLFPRLFGGGHAYLELTGEDLLDTGVSVMARPPGKRNSSIQLLSGGEKALTAVALVFAIFELNPAPFCMLDEVDAPLDDANVDRFCELLRSMSERVQFIFITHNKLTMEISSHLVGVTMQEPGVSRLVSVDVAEAARLAAV